MAVTREQVLQALRSVSYPGFRRDIVAAGAVREVIPLGQDAVEVRLDLGTGPDPAAADSLRSAVRAALLALPGLARAQVSVGPTGAASPGLRMASPPAPSRAATPSAAAGGALDAGLLPGVHHVVAVASGKGGVGKSTVAVNLAVALAGAGWRTGLLDADVYGPSIPLMMGVDEPPRLTPEGRQLIPFERHGVRFMSLGFLVEREVAVIWRGPMVMKALEQLLRDVVWGDLDVLVVDMPPGTGDAQLTLSQRVRLAGAVIVTTPQEVALADAVKGVQMFRKVGVPILGLVENMSHFVCPGCGERAEIFGADGGKREAERLRVPLLGQVPLHPAIRQGGDRGAPVAAGPDEDPTGRAFRQLAGLVRERLEAGGDGPDA